MVISYSPRIHQLILTVTTNPRRQPMRLCWKTVKSSILEREALDLKTHPKPPVKPSTNPVLQKANIRKNFFQKDKRSKPKKPATKKPFKIFVTPMPITKYKHSQHHKYKKREMIDVKRVAEDAVGSVAVKKTRNNRNAPKYYGVREGKSPGVYTSWDDCKSQISGYKGVIYKSFPTREEAEAFILGKPVQYATTTSEPKFYAVARGNKVGIFSTWEEASTAIKHAIGPKHKKFTSHHEAMDFIRQYASPAMIAAVEQGKVVTGPEASKENGNEDPPRAKPVVKMEIQLGSDVWAEHVHVYTDGSSRGNGKVGSVGGVGVWFGEGDPRNVSEPLAGELQTNQRAELTAILMALERVPHNEKILIIIDSQYAINCATKWAKNWISKNWTNSTGDEVKNQDLVKAIIKEMELREAAGGITSFKWVKGHNNDPGNVAANMLAVEGAMMGRG